MIKRVERGKKDKPFSYVLFGTIIAFWLLFFNVLMFTLYFFEPNVWRVQYTSGFVAFVVPFVLFHLFNSLVEWIFHRYILHSPLIPYILAKKPANTDSLKARIATFFYNLYEKHDSIHHMKTGIFARVKSEGSEQLIVKNIYPIVKEMQHEASYFPWATFFYFAVFTAPLFGIVQFLFPELPILSAGLCALAFSLTLYEVRHAMDHWSDERLEKWFFRWPIIGPWIKERFKFHRGHHADIWRNMGISCFFLIPLWDIIFRTHAKAESFYEDGSNVITAEFEKPTPVWFVRRLDLIAEEAREWKIPDVEEAA